MKRGFDGSNKSQAGGGETKADFKRRSLLDEFLELQKEFVSKKRKLETAKQRRDTLMAEILFLRRRHRYLLKSQSCEMELAKDEAREENNHLNPCSDLNLNAESGTKETLRIEKMPNDYLIDDKRVGKKKLYRHGRVTVKV